MKRELKSPIKNGFGAISDVELENIQKNLLLLLEEFDGICKENDITYYLDGGSVIGALRHGGFIPWDDDIDILIKRDEFKKLKNILEKITVNNSSRHLSYVLNKNSHHRPFARYIRTDIPHILRNSITEAEYTPGIFLDIFILDGVESKYLNKYTRLLERSEEWFHKRLNGVVGTATVFEYLLANIFEKLFGTKLVAQYYINRLEKYQDASKTIDYFIPRNGFNYAVYEADVFQEPKFVLFGDKYFPVPTKPEKFLRTHYSIDWFNMPEADVRYSHHFTLTSDLLSTEEIKDNFDWTKDRKNFFKVQSKRHFLQVIRKRSIVKHQLELVRLSEVKYKLELEKYLFENVPLNLLHELENNCDFNKIIDLLTFYFNQQEKLLRNYPQAKRGIRLPDGYLYFVILGLLMQGRFWDAYKIVNLYDVVDSKVSYLQAILSDIIKIECAIQDGDFLAAEKAIQQLPNGFLDATNVVVYRKKLGLLNFDNLDIELDFYIKLLKLNGYSYDLEFLIGNCYFFKHDYQAAKDSYNKVIQGHRNGLMVLESKDRLDIVNKKMDISLVC